MVPLRIHPHPVIVDVPCVMPVSLQPPLRAGRWRASAVRPCCESSTRAPMGSQPRTVPRDVYLWAPGSPAQGSVLAGPGISTPVLRGVDGGATRDSPERLKKGPQISTAAESYMGPGSGARRALPLRDRKSTVGDRLRGWCSQASTYHSDTGGEHQSWVVLPK